MTKPVRQFGKETQFFLNDGTIAAGGFLYQYASGTTTPVNTYTTNDLVSPVANANPMTLDSAGRLSQDVYITQAMKFVLKDSNLVTLWTIDTISATDQLWTLSAKTTDYTTTAADNYKLITVDATAGNVTVTLLAAATAGAGYIQAIKKIDSAANTVTIDPNSSETMDTGHTTLVLRNQGETALFISDGTNWKLISLYYGEAIVDGSVFTFSKGITITAGDLTLTSGNLTLTSGNETITNGNLTLTNGVASIAKDDAVNSSGTTILTLTHTTSGTPTNGIATNILFNAESADESPCPIGTLSFQLNDVTAASEDSALVIYTRIAGAALAASWQLYGTGASYGTFANAATAPRTYVLPDYDINFNHGAFRATDAGTSVNTATYTKMTCETETFDVNSWYDNATNFRYTPLVSGYYQIGGHAQNSTTLNAAGIVKVAIYKNGTVYQEAGTRDPGGGNEMHANVTALVFMNGSTDYVELYIYQDGGGTETMLAQFWGHHIPSI